MKKDTYFGIVKVATEMTAKMMRAHPWIAEITLDNENNRRTKKQSRKKIRGKLKNVPYD